MKGVPIQLDGEEVWFVPFKTGTSDRPKRAAFYKMIEACDAHDKTEPSETTATLGQRFEEVCESVRELAYQMLLENYGPERSAQLADQIPAGWTQVLATIARTAKAPADFTMTRPAGQK